MLKEIIIYGASGHGKVIAELIQAAYQDINIFFADDREVKIFFELHVGNPKEVLNKDSQIIIGIGNNRIRKRISNELFNSNFVTLVHPRAYVSNSAKLNSGTVVMAGACINTNALIGAHVIINTNSSIDHDCIIDDYAHISPNVGLAGNVKIGEGSHIGIGANIIQGIRVGKWAIVGAGAVVIADVPDYAVVVGVPAKIVKFSVENDS
ncbi:MAG: acetyltransferase [Bacteroidota bacterium]